ncbi:MAG: type II toxin-antitoxin system HicB family antitoxin [Lachnospiraceae bacterium]
MKAIYPVILTESNGCYLVEVPDMNILTEGTDLENAIEMARDAIGAMAISTEDAGETLPIASKIGEIDVSKGAFAAEGTSLVTLVDINLAEYRKKYDNRMVRRNVTLPAWLNGEAEKAKINVSKVLQDALQAKLNVFR